MIRSYRSAGKRLSVKNSRHLRWPISRPKVLNFHISGSIRRNAPVKSKLQHPPWPFEFWTFFVQMPPSLGRKAVQMPPPPGKLPDYCFNFSVASIIYASEAAYGNMV